MKITIKDKDIELKNTLRSMIMYENITEKSFNPETVTDIITYMYCVVIASSNDYTLTFDEFINYVDENPTIFDEFGQWLTSITTSNNALKKN